MAYMPDEQILRILGQNDRYSVDKKTGMIIDNQTQQSANLRDVRNLEYNIRGEEAPGNLSKRMLELSAFMEMQQQGLPVPPELIIEKTDISESDRQKWMQYLQQQSQSQQQQQEQMMQAELQFKDRELTNDEKQTLNDFILGIAKIKQAEHKDELKQQTSLHQTSIQDEQSTLQYILGLAAIAQKADQARTQVMSDQAIARHQASQRSKTNAK